MEYIPGFDNINDNYQQENSNHSTKKTWIFNKKSDTTNNLNFCFETCHDIMCVFEYDVTLFSSMGIFKYIYQNSSCNHQAK